MHYFKLQVHCEFALHRWHAKMIVVKMNALKALKVQHSFM